MVVSRFNSQPSLQRSPEVSGPFFFKCLRYTFVMPCVPRTPDYAHAGTHAIGITSHLAPIAAFGAHRFFSGGVSGVRASPFFFRALAGRNGPPEPPV
jgi:hypothetical protein